MAKLDSTVIYGTLNVNEEVKIKQVEINNKGNWCIVDRIDSLYTNLTTNATNGYQFDKSIYLLGNTIYGQGKEALRFNSTWLQVNSTSDFTSGVYFGNSVLRTDNRIEVGAAGIIFAVDVSTFTYNENTIWHAGNDGSGSTLDADTVDTYHVDTALLGWGGGLVINGSNGVTDIGRYLDFHNTATGDYHIRLDCESTSVLNILGGTLEVGGTTVSLNGHTHSYLPLGGGTLTGDLTTGSAIVSTRATGQTMLAFPGTESGIHRLTDQGGLSMFCDSSMILFAGDGWTKISAGEGITAGSTTESMIIAADGDLVFLPDQQTAYNAGYRIVMSAGTITSASNVTAYSDIRLKDNIKELETIDFGKIKLYEYNRNDRDNEYEKGVIAQEVEKVLPTLVREDKTGIKSVDYAKLGALSGISANKKIKELQNEINLLKEEIFNIKEVM